MRSNAGQCSGRQPSAPAAWVGNWSGVGASSTPRNPAEEQVAVQQSLRLASLRRLSAASAGFCTPVFL